MEELIKPIAYSGTEPYLFVSYSHLDAQIVFPIIRQLQHRGIRIWYDDAIEAGSEFPQYIENALLGDTAFVQFISPNAVDSFFCRNEIGLSLDSNRTRTMIVYLEPTELKYGLKLELRNIQSLMYDNGSDTFYNKFLLALNRAAPTIFSSSMTETQSKINDVSPGGSDINGNRLISTANEAEEISTEHVVIKENIESTEKRQFYENVNMISIELPDSLLNIESWTFEKCINLEKINIPQKVSSIGYRAFYHCTHLCDVNFPDSLCEIGPMAFAECTALESVTITSSVTNVGDSAYLDCTGLKKVYFACSISTVREETFHGCSALEEITLGKGLKRIEKSAFEGCCRLTSIILPNTLEVIGDRAFAGCTNLKQIILPERLRSIGKWAFSDCIGITQFTVPDNVKYIKEGTFINCTNLRLVSLPSDCTVEGRPFPTSCKIIRRKKTGGKKRFQR